MTEREILELFLLYYPTKEEHVTSQVSIGDAEYMFYIDDGSRVRFDLAEHSMCYIKPREELSAEEADDIWSKEFSRKLKKKLKRARITQKEFARLLGITDRTIYRYLNRKTLPDYLTIRRMATILRCSVNDLTNFDYLY